MVLIFCEINGKTPGFYLVLLSHIHNPVKQIIWGVLQIQLTIFAKISILDVSLGSEYAFDYRLWIRLWICLCFFYHYFHFESMKFRFSHSQMPFTINVFKNFAIFTGKYLRWSLFVITLPACKSADLLKRFSNTCVLLWIFPNF